MPQVIDNSAVCRYFPDSQKRAFYSTYPPSRFEREVTAFPEVILCHSVSGSADFMLQVVSRDLDTYAEFAMTRLRRLPGIKAMMTSFVLKEIKPPKGLPLDH